MPAAIAEDEEEKPLDPAVERVRRRLVRFLAVNAVILIFALMTVAAAVVYRATRTGDAPAVAAVAAAVGLPAGARVISHSLSGDRLSLHLTGPGGAATILVLDIRTGAVVGRFALQAD